MPQNYISVDSLILFYPALNPSQDKKSVRDYGTNHFITKDYMKYLTDSYLVKTPEDHAKLWPLTQSKINRLPPTTIFSSSYDLLKDDATDLKSVLSAHMIECKLLEIPLPHGFMQLPLPRKLKKSIKARLNIIDIYSI
jgi:acetyl esterase/lipase